MFAQWVKKQLRDIDRIQTPVESTFDDMAMIVAEAGRRAAKAGLPAAVDVCDIRPGPVGIDLARKILAECLAAIPTPDDDGGPLTVAQAAERLGVKEKRVYEAVASGELASYRVGRQIRIRPEDLDAFQRRPPAETDEPKVRPDRERHFG